MSLPLSFSLLFIPLLMSLLKLWESITSVRDYCTYMVFIIAQQTDYVGKLLLPREPYWRSYGIVFSLLSVRRSRSRCFQYMYYLYWIAFLHCWNFSRSFLLSSISFNDNFIFSTLEPAIHNSDRFQRISEFINIEIKSFGMIGNKQFWEMISSDENSNIDAGNGYLKMTHWL